MHDSEQPDEALHAAYRGLPPEAPPSAIDAAVLAASRRGVAKRPHQWRVPAALAAVLVLSVGVTLRVGDEQPEIPMANPSPPASEEAAKPVAPQSESKADAPVAGPPPQAERQARPASPSARALARPEPTAPAREESAVSPTFVPSPQSDAVAPAAAQSAGQLAQSAARADRRAPMMAKRSMEASNLASGAPALTPEAWLERIIELRASARYKEAEESYAEFRRRYPDYPIPPEKLEKIAPPR